MRWLRWVEITVPCHGWCLTATLFDDVWYQILGEDEKVMGNYDSEKNLKAKRRVLDIHSRSHGRAVVISSKRTWNITFWGWDFRGDWSINRFLQLFLLDLIDMGLLLFWRNAAHHFENETNETEPQHGARYQPDFSATHSKSLALVSVSNGTRAGQELNLKEDALQSLRPIFHRLQNLDLVSLNFIFCVREREGVCVCVSKQWLNWSDWPTHQLACPLSL